MNRRRKHVINISYIICPFLAAIAAGQQQPQLIGKFVCTGTPLIALRNESMSVMEAKKHSRVVTTPVKIVNVDRFYHFQVEGDPLFYRVDTRQSRDFYSDHPCAVNPTAFPSGPMGSVVGVIAGVDAATQTFKVLTKEGSSITLTFTTPAGIIRTENGVSSNVKPQDIQNGDQLLQAVGQYTDSTRSVFVANNSMLKESEAAARAHPVVKPDQLLIGLAKSVTPEEAPEKIAQKYWDTILTECGPDKFYSDRVNSRRGTQEIVTDWTITEFRGPFNFCDNHGENCAKQAANIKTLTFRPVTDAERQNFGRKWVAAQSVRSTTYRFIKLHFVTELEYGGLKSRSFKTSWSPWKDSVKPFGALIVLMRMDGDGIHFFSSCDLASCTAPNWYPQSCDVLTSSDPFSRYAVEVDNTQTTLPSPLPNF